MTRLQSSKRIEPRNPITAAIACRPFSGGFFQTSDGIMRNFSKGGAYIETSGKFKRGTLVLVRTTVSLNSSSPSLPAKGPRSISLAIVQWVRDIAGEAVSRYGMGLKYLK